jgi:hypothetical protein
LAAVSAAAVSLVRHPKGAKSEYLGLTLQIDLLMISPPFGATDFFDYE